MAIKTFNIDEEKYRIFAEHCKKNGLSMSKQIEFFITAQITEEPKIRKEYLEKLEKIRKFGKFRTVNNINEIL